MKVDSLSSAANKIGIRISCLMGNKNCQIAKELLRYISSAKSIMDGFH